MPYDEIQNAFLEGLNELYLTLFTDKVMFETLATSQTNMNSVYQESVGRAYNTPIYLSGRVVINTHEGELVVESTQFFTEIKIPTKQLIDNEIPFSTEADLKKLEGARFTYKNLKYLVQEVVPTTLLADMYQVYQFKCKEESENTLGRA